MQFKLPHGVIVVLTLIAGLIPWVSGQAAAGVITLPSWYAPVSGLIVLLLGGLGIYSPSASVKVNTRAVADSVRPPPPSPPPVATGMLMMVSALALTLLTGCASSPIWAQLGATLEQDLLNGSALSVLENVVDTFFPQYANNIAATDAIIQEFISYLQSIGVLPPSAQANAQAVLDAIKAKAAASPAAKKSELPPDLERLLSEIRAGRYANESVRIARTLGAREVY
jgi:hypothetical protein